MIIKSKLFYINILLLLFSIQSCLCAQSTKTEITRPHLEEHKFVMSPYVASSFVKTYLRSTLGFGQAMNLHIPVLIINGQPLIGLRGDVSFLAIVMEYQYAINDWAGIFIKGGVNTRFGTEVQSLVAQGVNATYGSEIGWLFNLMKTKNVMFSATLGIINKSGTVIDLLGFIEEVIDSSGLTENNKLMFSHDFLQGEAGLRLAWAINKFFGLQSSLELAYGESIGDISRNEIYYKFSAAIDFDVKNINNDIPVGFSYGFLVDSFTSANDNTVDGNAWATFFRTAYTGRDDILISFDLSYYIMPFGRSDKLKTYNALVSLEYYFD